MSCSDTNSLEAQLETQKSQCVSTLQESVFSHVTSFYDSILLKVHSLRSPLDSGELLTSGTDLQEAIHRDGEYYRNQLMTALTESFNVKLPLQLEVQETLEKQVELIDLVSDEEEENEDGLQTMEQASSTSNQSTLSLRRSKRKYRKAEYTETMERPENGQQTTSSSSGWRPLLSSTARPSFPIQKPTSTLARPHSCPFGACSARFKYKCELTLHKRRHTGERPFVCANCGKTFISKGNLNTHLAHCPSASTSQEESSPCGRYPCLLGHCHTFFHFKYQREAHQRRRHPGARPYVCAQCRKAYTKKSYLLTHLQTVHRGKKRYGCSWPRCTRTSFAQADIIKHIRVVHFKLPKTVREQLERGIPDERDASLFCRKIASLS